MDKSRTVYLARHGKIQLEDDRRRYIGQLDLPLDEEGVKQAEHLQKRLHRVDFKMVFCSDLSRSRQTAEIVATNRNISIIPRQDLREIALGSWEGRTFTDIARLFPHEFKSRGADIGYYRVPGGESFADCSRRVIMAFEEALATAAGDILIIGHAGVNRLLLCHILGMPIANLFRLGQDYGCLNVIHCGSSGYQAHLINSR